ncbi:T9SS type A sorting domain-containing protein [Flavobacterium sp.]|uniref:T9SS type A sorting domain-containing protein n=1 Tax=Flavobacterium sp. TaxID=239 RepID=UPI003750640B
MKKLLLIITLFSVAFLNAQNIFQDDFSTYTSNQQLSGQGTWTNNSSNPGGLGVATSGGVNSFVIDNNISYLNYGTSTKSIQIKPNSDGCGRAFTSVSSGSLYVGFVINLSVAQANNNSDFFRILSGDNFNTSCRLYATNAGGGFFIGVAKGANGNTISFTPNSYNYNQNHLVIIKYSQNVGANDDVVSVFVNPIYNSGEPTVPTTSTFSGNDQSGTIDRLSFRQNWTNGMPTGFVGLVSTSLTWADLTFQPLAVQEFSSSNFTIVSNEVKSGLLSIKSNLTLENVNLNIYDIQGRVLENKTISLNDYENNIQINSITNSGVYIVELVSDKGKFSQKIVVN